MIAMLTRKPCMSCGLRLWRVNRLGITVLMCPPCDLGA